jgi:hypothetical protein
MSTPMAKKIYSQIRKGAVFHDEWKDAFASGKFMQKNGRSRGASSVDDDVSRNIISEDEAESDETGGNGGSSMNSTEGADDGGDSASSKIGKHHKKRRQECLSAEFILPKTSVREGAIIPCHDPCTLEDAVATVPTSISDIAETSTFLTRWEESNAVRG